MSTASEAAGMPATVTSRLGYLLKHAQLRLAELSVPALAPLGIDGRQLAVLTLLAEGEPQSQQEAAVRLGVDRTSMVALVDELEGKGLVLRQVDPGDRRKRIVQPTGEGLRVLREGAAVTEEVEREFLSALGQEEARRLRDALRLLVSG